MEFCNCGSYLFKKEIIKEDTKKLIYYCQCCNYQKDCQNYKIYSKIYKNNNNIINNDIEKNRMKLNDQTLPSIKIKCKKCKKINENKYEIHYINNSYHRNIICKNCYTNWLK
jgi:DNA-directed RNA polymerase subunit M/transcription elongation factor TFIIS|tara:strand:- start:1488 stop:1823 length:336 start_codon:yes stop_codon:yes gene_type:complete